MVDANDYFGNYFRTFEYLVNRNIRRIREGIDKTRWLEELVPTDINAAYIPNLNQFGMQIVAIGQTWLIIIKYILLQCFWREYLDFPHLIQGGQSKLCTD